MKMISLTDEVLEEHAHLKKTFSTDRVNEDESVIVVALKGIDAVSGKKNVGTTNGRKLNQAQSEVI